MKVIGITGGIGSGKSMVLSLLETQFQAKVVQADLLAKSLQEPGEIGYENLLALLGPQILALDGTIDRSYLGQLIFKQKDIRKQVNELIHPLVWSEIKKIVKESKTNLVVVEAALFDESSKQICDELWVVDASETIRIKRLMENRGYTKEKAESIMKTQRSREDFLQMADVVIINDTTIDEVVLQLREKLEPKEETDEIS